MTKEEDGFRASLWGRFEGAIDAFHDTDREVLPDTAWQFILYFARQAKGPFLLLLIADKLQLEASPSVVKACETIIRAHEACVVTLNTEYQVCRCRLRCEYDDRS